MYDTFSYLFYRVFKLNPKLESWVVFPLIIRAIITRTGNTARQKKTYAHEKKWDANKTKPEMWLEGNASLFFRDVT